MNFPITLHDKLELDTLIRKVSKETATQVLMQTGYIKPNMHLSECYRLSSRRKVDNAIWSGKLKCVKKDESVFVKREHFEEWLNTHDFFL